MTRTPPSVFKSRAALLDWTLSRAGSIAASLRSASPRGPNPEIDLRLQMASLLQSADFVLQISEAAGALKARAAAPDRTEYIALDVGHLRGSGYLQEEREAGTLALASHGQLLPFTAEQQEGGKSFVLTIGSRQQQQRLEVTSTEPSFGGRRFWFVCPGLEAACGNRVLRVYRTLSGGPFACHACHKAAHDSGWRSARDRSVFVSTVARAG